MAQLMPLPLTVSCFGNIQIGFTFLVPAHLGSPGQRAVKRVCVFIVPENTVIDSLTGDFFCYSCVVFNYLIFNMAITFPTFRCLLLHILLRLV